MKKILLSLITAAVLLSCQSSRDTSHKYTAITPGVEWLDTNNEKINAHGGGILYHEGIYYWYGECKSDSTYWNPNVPGWECYRTEAGGVNCYSSWCFHLSGFDAPERANQPGHDPIQR